MGEEIGSSYVFPISFRARTGKGTPQSLLLRKGFGRTSGGVFSRSHTKILPKFFRSGESLCVPPLSAGPESWKWWGREFGPDVDGELF